MSAYKNFSPKYLKELCCWMCGKLDKDIFQLDNGSRICSKCPATSSKEQKEKDPYARKIIRQLILDYGDIDVAQEFINSLIAEIDYISEKETLVPDEDSESDGDNPLDSIEKHQSEETTTNISLNKHQLEEAKELGISPDEYEKHLECQEWKTKLEDELSRLRQARDEHKLKETCIEELKERLAVHGLAERVTNEPEE